MKPTIYRYTAPRPTRWNRNALIALGLFGGSFLIVTAMIAIIYNIIR